MSGKPKAEYGPVVDFTPSGKPVTHGGSGTAYANYGCKCQPCTEANTSRNARRRAEREAMTARGEIPPSVVHGKDSTYSNWGCRCDECSLAHTEKGKDYRENLTRTPDPDTI